jgi:hypothetical protein
MEEEEKKIEEKVGWNVGPTRERKEEMKDVIYIFSCSLGRKREGGGTMHFEFFFRPGRQTFLL